MTLAPTANSEQLQQVGAANRLGGTVLQRFLSDTTGLE